MNRTRTIRTAALIALPFLLLPAGVWASGAVYESTSDLQWWWVARWSLRAIYCSGALWGWLAGRPRWFYPWLGFAVYEVVATLFGVALYIENGGRFVAVAFATYLAAVLWVGGWLSQRLLAAYAVFPHAALMFQLASYIVAGPMPRELWVGTLLSAAAAPVFAVLFWLAPSAVSRGHGNRVRAAVLYGGVLVCQLFHLIEAGNNGPGSPIITRSMPFSLAVLGWVILSCPLLLPPLIKSVLKMLRILQTGICKQK